MFMQSPEIMRVISSSTRLMWAIRRGPGAAKAGPFFAAACSSTRPLRKRVSKSQSASSTMAGVAYWAASIMISGPLGFLPSGTCPFRSSSNSSSGFAVSSTRLSSSFTCFKSSGMAASRLPATNTSLSTSTCKALCVAVAATGIMKPRESLMRISPRTQASQGAPKELTTLCSACLAALRCSTSLSAKAESTRLSTLGNSKTKSSCARCFTQLIITATTPMRTKPAPPRVARPGPDSAWGDKVALSCLPGFFCQTIRRNSGNTSNFKCREMLFSLSPPSSVWVSGSLASSSAKSGGTASI
mmetsp:Transcript_36211/g.83186  ORF Transcript_36211/g.83186 Transcript_36211/m.83186 type:complete len:300 (-) Transcript_36211:3212-4111(-)